LPEQHPTKTAIKTDVNSSLSIGFHCETETQRQGVKTGIEERLVDPGMNLFAVPRCYLTLFKTGGMLLK